MIRELFRDWPHLETYGWIGQQTSTEYGQAAPIFFVPEFGHKASWRGSFMDTRSGIPVAQSDSLTIVGEACYEG